MPEDDLRHPARLLRGLRHTRRFLDQPVPLAVVDQMLAAGQAIGEDVRLLVIDDLETKRDLTAIGSFPGSMSGAATVIVVILTSASAADDRNQGSRVADAVMLEATRNQLGTGYGWFTTREQQSAIRQLLGVSPPARVLVAIGTGYIDDSPDPGGSSLNRVQATLSDLAGNRDGSVKPE